MGLILDQYGQIQFDEAGRPLVDELNDGLLVYPDAQPRTSQSTTTLEAGLAHYLTDPRPYAGHAQRPFKTTKTIDGVTVANRNDARRELQSRIGQRIYLDRRPQDAEDDACIVIRHVTATHDYGLAGETDGVQTFLQATVYASGADAARRGGTIYGLLQLCVSGYHEGYWGDVLIGEATIDGGRSLAYSPADNSDKWTFTRQMDLVVYYYSATVPEYSDWRLQALPEMTVTSTELRLTIGRSLVPEGATLANAGWLVRATATGPVIASCGGHPDCECQGTGISGTNANPIFSRATFTTIPNNPHVTLILTDSSGEVSAKGVTLDG